MREFTRLSSQEVLFRTQAQSTAQESLASRRPDQFLTYYEILQSDQKSSEAKDKAMEEIVSKENEAWIRTNASLFKHVLDYEHRLDAFLDKAGGWIREQEEHIWMMMFRITGDIGVPLCASLNILLHLLETLPFRQTLHTRASHPSFAGSRPKLMLTPG